MVRPKKRPGARRPGSKPKTSASINRRSPHLPRPRRTSFEDNWEAFVEAVQNKMQRSLDASDAKTPPYNQPAAVLKRMTYQFVRRYDGRVKSSLISTAIENYRINVENAKTAGDFVAIRSIRKPYEGNEFHYVLLGLKSAFSIKDFFSEVDYTLEKHDVTRYSAQLQYAARHEVPPNYLIGFLYQSGTVTEICRKAKDPNVREEWFKPA